MQKKIMEATNYTTSKSLVRIIFTTVPRYPGLIKARVRTGVMGVYSLVSTGQMIPPGASLEDHGLVGDSEEIDLINEVLLDMRSQIRKAYLRLKITRQSEPTPFEVMAEYANQYARSTISFITTVNEYCSVKRLSTNRKKGYKTLVNAFLKFVGKEDLPMAVVDTKLVNGFCNYLFDRDGRKVSTVFERTKQLNAIINYAIEKRYVSQDHVKPYHNKKLATEKSAVPQRRVRNEDLLRIEHEPMPYYQAYKLKTLLRVRNLFLLQSWTGLSFADLDAIGNKIKSLIITDLSNKRSLVYHRVKTGTAAIVPFFNQTESLLDALEYDIYPYMEYRAYRRRIKSLFKTYAIEGNVGAHTGRHCFGARMLDMGFSIDSISSMMGHSNSAITRAIYAPVDSAKINKEFEEIESRN
jgi:integrase